jgi:hypothetical protein
MRTMGEFMSSWRTRLHDRRQRTMAIGLRLHERYNRLFWALHSTWALLTGIVVLVLAHNRYGYLKWVVLFLGLTWASTLFFSRFAVKTTTPARRFAEGFVSYITRVMYQETLFFLLPFYFFSTTFPSLNCGYVIVLAGLAALSCFDLVFDRLLRTSRPFAVGFFAFVTYSALQFFLPLVLAVRIHNGAYLAAAAAFFASLPVAYSWRELKQGRRLVSIGLVLIAIIAVLKVGRGLIPPVPLRLVGMSFADGIDPRTLQLDRELKGTVSVRELSYGRLCVRGTIFFPGTLKVDAHMRFFRNGELIKTSRTLELTAHRWGFRVWDAVRADRGRFLPGRYRVELWTHEGQLVGRDEIRLTDQVRGTS